jgi:hypothetical protein
LRVLVGVPTTAKYQYPTVKELVKGNTVRFLYYKCGELWYEVLSGLDIMPVEPPFRFPVPVSDTGDGRFMREDKAIFFMRYIRQHVEHLKEDEVKDPVRAVGRHIMRVHHKLFKKLAEGGD